MKKQVLPLRMGLSTLLYDPTAANNCLDDAVARSVALYEHPFNLTDSMRDHAIPNRECETLYLIAEPMIFQDGVKALTQLVRGLAGLSELMSNPFRYLRKIKTPGDAKVLAFYEVGTTSGVFLGGSEVTHGFGRWEYESQRMDAMFHIIQMVYGVPFEECTPVVNNEAVIQNLEHLWIHRHRDAA